MSVRDCIRDVAAAHGMAGSLRRLDKDGTFCEIRRCMGNFCDGSWLSSQELSPGIKNKDLDESKIALDMWKEFMIKFYEFTFRCVDLKVEFDTLMRSSTYTQDATTMSQKSISPFKDFLHKVRQSTGKSAAGKGKNTEEVTSMLFSSVDIVDFYYRYHILRTIYQSRDKICDLLELADTELKLWVDSFAFDESQFKETSIYFSFRNVQENLFYILARKRGLVPSSFYVTGIVRCGDHPVGLGGFADVWMGRDMTRSHQIVALKVLKTFDNGDKTHSDVLKALCREAMLWQMTSHPHVLSFLGVCKLDDERLQSSIALASPFMKNGNLLVYVKKNTEANRSTLLKQVSNGLIYLHDIDIIHGDLKCSNVLVTDEGVAQLSDFGLSSVGNPCEGMSSSTSNSAGNPRWLAPELMFPELFNGSGRCTRESDVYAFGMTALELFTGERPFFYLPDAAVPYEVAIERQKPSWPGEEAEACGLTRGYWKVMERCWSHEPALRPRTTITAENRPRFFSTFSINLEVICFFPYIAEKVILRGRSVDANFWGKKGCSADLFTVEFDEAALATITACDRTRDDYCLSKGRCKCSQFEERYVSCRLLHNFETDKINESNVWRRTWCHPNVAPMLGYCKVSLLFSFGIVYDIGLCSEPLLRYLYRAPDKNRLRIMEEISRGLNYLHQHAIVHGDLRSVNIVVERGNVRLVDYSLPASVREDRHSFQCQVFRAPELVGIPDGVSEQPTRNSDVYSLAMTFYEVLTEEIPFAEDLRPKTEILSRIIEKKYRPEYPASTILEKRGLSSKLWALMSRCWSANDVERPAALYVADRVKKLRNVETRPL